MINLIIYTVKKGDSVYSISKKYGVPMKKIIGDNQLDNPNLLIIGQALVLSTNDVFHKAATKQTLSSIAQMYGTSAESLLAVNSTISDTSQPLNGQIVIIPQPSKKQRTIDVNGFSFPSINQNVLESTLPYLTFNSIFSYQVRPDGTLVEIPDELVIKTSVQADVLPIMVITNIKEGGSFDSEIAHIILTNEQVQATLFENIIKTLREKNYRGLDIDFEYIYPEDKENYNKFLEKAAATLRPLGYILSSSIAPKLSETQSGLLYEAHDYKAHGQFMDHVIIMTYEWGYTFGHSSHK